jgi:DNA repair protein RecO (recombination protein O)
MESTDAIILKAAPYSETTLMLTLLTRDQGVVRALAKGARRGYTSVQAAFEPFTWIECNLRLKSHDALGSLFSPEIQESWDYLRSDVDKLAYAGLGLEVIGGLALHSPPEPAFFDEAVEFLRVLGATTAAGSLTIALLLRLLHEAGFPPQLAEPWTEETLPQTLTYHFEGGRFEESHPGDPLHSMRLPRIAMLYILPALFQPPPLDGSFQVGSQAGPQVLRWLISVWQDHLNEPLKAARFFEKMVGEH